MLYTKPSFYALVITGLLLLVIVIVAIKNFREIKNLETYKLVMLLSLIAVVVGVHGMAYAQLEQQYNFNPIEMIMGKTKK